MKTVAQIVVLIAAVAVLYALPAPSPDECPEGEDWSCVQYVSGDDADASNFDDDAALSELVESMTGEDGGAEEEEDADVGVELTSDGVLSVDTNDAEFEDDLLSGTKWSPELLATAADARVVAVTFEPDEVSPAAPRVMESSPTRIQIIDLGDEDVVFDHELPEETVWMEWLADNRLVLGSDDGSITVIEAN